MKEDMVKKSDDQTFAEMSKSGIVLIDFYAEWCGPCRVQTPIIEALAEEFAGKVIFLKVDVDQAQKVATTYQITSIPTLILLKDGKEIQRTVGLKDKESLKKMLQSA